jgi:hypothetical protein
MLSDSCAEFIDGMIEGGVTSDMYTTLRWSILHYQKKPFSYPPEICKLLVAAVDAVRKPRPSIGYGTFLRLLIATHEAYWDFHGDKEEKLPQTLRDIWPGPKPKPVKSVGTKFSPPRQPGQASRPMAS